MNEYGLPLPDSFPQGIVAGPDGALWFTEASGNRIGRITTGGAITEYPLPSNSNPWAITAGPDGALWFTAAQNIGRITTSGELTEYPTNLPPFLSITSGSDGALWFTSGSSSISRMTTTGAITQYDVPVGLGSFSEIISGPDGALWFTYPGQSQLGRSTTNGEITILDMPPDLHPNHLCVGTDGAIWTDGAANLGVGRITTTGDISTYPAPPQAFWSGGVSGITAGPGSTIWFTASLTFNIGEVVFATASLSAAPDSGFPGSTVTLTGSGFLPGESVNLFAGSTGTNQLGTAAADSSGAFLINDARARQGGYGSHSIVAVGQMSGRIGVGTFFIEPFLKLEPNSGPPGTTVTAEGVGFGAPEHVDLRWDTFLLLLGTATADRMGTFAGQTALTFTIPADATPGQHLVRAIGLYTWFGGIAKAYFTVQ